MPIPSLYYIKYKRLFFSVNEYFTGPVTKLDADINYCIQCPENVNGKLEEFHTLLIDLQQPEEQIWNNIYHRTRFEIRSFLNNQVFEHRLELNPTRELLSELIGLFNKFAAYKNIRRAEKFRLQAFHKNNLLAISYIKQKGQFICINFYRLTRERAANLYTFHLRHQLGHLYSSSHYGRAHKALHWLDIQCFKKENVASYDFCGWYSGTENKTFLNINHFKEQFTKHKVKEYSGVIYNHPLLSALKKLR